MHRRNRHINPYQTQKALAVFDSRCSTSNFYFPNGPGTTSAYCRIWYARTSTNSTASQYKWEDYGSNGGTWIYKDPYFGNNPSFNFYDAKHYTDVTFAVNASTQTTIINVFYIGSGPYPNAGAQGYNNIGGVGFTAYAQCVANTAAASYSYNTYASSTQPYGYVSGNGYTSTSAFINGTSNNSAGNYASSSTTILSGTVTTNSSVAQKIHWMADPDYCGNQSRAYIGISFSAYFCPGLNDALRKRFEKAVAFCFKLKCN